MPYKDPNQKRAYDRKYQQTHPEKIREIKARRKKKDREIWRNYWKRKKERSKDLDRINKIKLGLIYKNKKPIYS